MQVQVQAQEQVQVQVHLEEVAIVGALQGVVPLLQGRRHVNEHLQAVLQLAGGQGLVVVSQVNRC